MNENEFLGGDKVYLTEKRGKAKSHFTGYDKAHRKEENVSPHIF